MLDGHFSKEDVHSKGKALSADYISWPKSPGRQETRPGWKCEIKSPRGQSSLAHA